MLKRTVREKFSHRPLQHVDISKEPVIWIAVLAPCSIMPCSSALRCLSSFCSDVRSSAVCVCFSPAPEVMCSLPGGVIFAASWACDTVMSLTAALQAPLSASSWPVNITAVCGIVPSDRLSFLSLKYGLIYFQQSLPVSLPEFCENFFRRNTTKKCMDRRLQHNHRRCGGNSQPVSEFRLFNHQIFTFF